MKKVLAVLLSVLLLTGCNKTSEDTLKNFKDTNSFSTYELKANMSIINNEDEFTYDVVVDVLEDNYYKVSLTNTNNDNTQIILKNDEGVYVATPSLNKSFKFQSKWPNNSSQPYIISSLVNDTITDEETKIESRDEGYIIKSKVNYPNNEKMDHEEIYISKDYKVEKVIIYDKDNQKQMSIDVIDIDEKKKFDEDYFDLENYIKEDTEEENNDNEKCLSECTDTEENCKSTCNIESTSNTIEEIIYPLYVPADTYLSAKDLVSTDEGNRAILTFSGVSPFILVEEVSKTSDELNIIPVSGDPIYLSSSVGASSKNSIYWTTNGIDYYLTSKTLSKEEMMTIAESIENNTNLVAVTK